MVIIQSFYIIIHIIIYLNELCNFDNEHNASALIQKLFAKIRFQTLFKDY